MNLKSKTALAALSLIASFAAFAEDKPPESALAFNIGAVNDYRFRGIEQTSGGPSVQGGVDYSHSSGAYVGVWAASGLKWIKEFNGASKGEYEVDIYGGYKFEVKGIALDVGAITYQYPGNDSGAPGTAGAGAFSKADTTEVYIGGTYSVVTLKYNQSMGDFLGNLNSNGSRYWDLSATFDLGSGMTLVPHVGRQTIPNQSFGTKIGNAADYTDYALTLNKDFGNGVSALAAVVATDTKENEFYQATNNGANRFLGKNGVIVGVKYTF
jgi:uncharacterized protein (TIGR02001 family)